MSQSKPNVKDVFDHAAEIPSPADRDAYLNEACAAFPDLRREVEELLRAHAQVGSFLDHPVVAPADLAETVNAIVADTVALPTGTKVGYFGDYELLEVVARGGMGIVYKARQVTLNRVVALKMIRTGEFAGPGEVRRFLQEAEAAGTLNHPNIVPIYEVGEHSGQHYYAMRLVEGNSLADRMADFAVPGAVSKAEIRSRQTRAAGLIGTIARAVVHAHQRGILHRDLKPANILLDQNGEPHVTDFGLARRIDQDSSLTATGAALGTPSYMAPEQTGGGQPITTQTDVYGLGAVMYEVLTGRPPFKGKDVVDTMAQVRKKEPVRPRTVCPAVDRDLETICLTCLAKDPARRYSSTEAFADDLERWLVGKPIWARPTRPTERLAKWARRRPTAAALVASLILGTVALAGTGVYFTSKLDQKRQDAEMDRDRAKVSEDEAKKREAETKEQLDLTQRALLTAQLLRVGQLADRDPMLGLQLLLDTKVCPAEWRDFTWGYYYARCNRESKPLAIAPDAKWVVNAYSRDGRWFACAFRNGKECVIQIRDTATMQVVMELKDNLRRIESLAFSPNSRFLVYGGKQVVVWELASQKVVHRWTLAPGNARLVSFTSDSGTAFCDFEGDDGGEAIGWDMQTGNRCFALQFPFLTEAAVLSGDGRTVAVAGSGLNRLLNGFLGFSSPLIDLPLDEDLGAIYLFNTASGKLVSRLLGHQSWITGLVLSPDGKYLASSENYSGRIKVWALSTRKERLILKGHPGDQIESLACSGDGSTLASSHGRDIRIFDMPSGRERMLLRNTGGSPVLNADGSLVTIQDETWNISTRQEQRSFSVVKRPLPINTRYTAASDGQYLVIGIPYSQSGISLWDIGRGKQLAEWEGDFPTLSADGSTVAFTRTRSGRMEIVSRSIRTGKEPSDGGAG